MYDVTFVLKKRIKYVKATCSMLQKITIGIAEHITEHIIQFLDTFSHISMALSSESYI
jgi:hypothetical protein